MSKKSGNKEGPLSKQQSDIKNLLWRAGWALDCYELHEAHKKLLEEIWKAVPR